MKAKSCCWLLLMLPLAVPVQAEQQLDGFYRFIATPSPDYQMVFQNGRYSINWIESHAVKAVGTVTLEHHGQLLGGTFARQRETSRGRETETGNVYGKVIGTRAILILMPHQADRIPVFYDLNFQDTELKGEASYAESLINQNQNSHREELIQSELETLERRFRSTDWRNQRQRANNSWQVVLVKDGFERKNSSSVRLFKHQEETPGGGTADLRSPPCEFGNSVENLMKCAEKALKAGEFRAAALFASKAATALQPNSSESQLEPAGCHEVACWAYALEGDYTHAGQHARAAAEAVGRADSPLEQLGAARLFAFAGDMHQMAKQYEAAAADWERAERVLARIQTPELRELLARLLAQSQMYRAKNALLHLPTEKKEIGEACRKAIKQLAGSAEEADIGTRGWLWLLVAAVETDAAKAEAVKAAFQEFGKVGIQDWASLNQLLDQFAEETKQALAQFCPSGSELPSNGRSRIEALTTTIADQEKADLRQVMKFARPGERVAVSDLQVTVFPEGTIELPHTSQADVCIAVQNRGAEPANVKIELQGQMLSFGVPNVFNTVTDLQTFQQSYSSQPVKEDNRRLQDWRIQTNPVIPPQSSRGFAFPFSTKGRAGSFSIQYVVRRDDNQPIVNSSLKVRAHHEYAELDITFGKLLSIKGREPLVWPVEKGLELRIFPTGQFIEDEHGYFLLPIVYAALVDENSKTLVKDENAVRRAFLSYCVSTDVNQLYWQRLVDQTSELEKRLKPVKNFANYKYLGLVDGFGTTGDVIACLALAGQVIGTGLTGGSAGAVLTTAVVGRIGVLVGEMKSKMTILEIQSAIGQLRQESRLALRDIQEEWNRGRTVYKTGKNLRKAYSITKTAFRYYQQAAWATDSTRIAESVEQGVGWSKDEAARFQRLRDSIVNLKNLVLSKQGAELFTGTAAGLILDPGQVYEVNQLGLATRDEVDATVRLLKDANALLEKAGTPQNRSEEIMLDAATRLMAAYESLMFAYELEKATINANRQGISGWLAERGAGLQGVKVDDLLNDCAAQGEGCVFERNRILVTHLMAPLWVRCSLAGCITEVTDEALAMLDPKEPPPLSRVTTKAQRAGTAQPVKRANTTTAPVTTVPDKPPMGIQTPLTALQQNEARTAYFSGMMVMSGKRPAEAEKHFRRAADIDTRNVNYRVMLGNVLFEQQKWGEAAEAYRNAVQLEPDTGSHHANLATALLRAGKRDEAVTEAKEAMRCGIKEHSIYRELGLTPSP